MCADEPECQDHVVMRRADSACQVTKSQGPGCLILRSGLRTASSQLEESRNKDCKCAVELRDSSRLSQKFRGDSSVAERLGSANGDSSSTGIDHRASDKAGNGTPRFRADRSDSQAGERESA